MPIIGRLQILSWGGHNTILRECIISVNISAAAAGSEAWSSLPSKPATTTWGAESMRRDGDAFSLTPAATTAKGRPRHNNWEQKYLGNILAEGKQTTSKWDKEEPREGSTTYSSAKEATALWIVPTKYQVLTMYCICLEGGYNNIQEAWVYQLESKGPATGWTIKHPRRHNN